MKRAPCDGRICRRGQTDEWQKACLSGIIKFTLKAVEMIRTETHSATDARGKRDGVLDTDRSLLIAVQQLRLNEWKRRPYRKNGILPMCVVLEKDGAADHIPRKSS